MDHKVIFIQQNIALLKLHCIGYEIVKIEKCGHSTKGIKSNDITKLLRSQSA